jgi:hypothetical protein
VKKTVATPVGTVHKIREDVADSVIACHEKSRNFGGVRCCLELALLFVKDARKDPFHRTHATAGSDNCEFARWRHANTGQLVEGTQEVDEVEDFACAELHGRLGVPSFGPRRS